MWLQYWATTASCFSVLVYLCFILRNQFSHNHLLSLHGYWRNKLNIGFIALCAALFCVSTAKSFSGKLLTLGSEFLSQYNGVLIDFGTFCKYVDWFLILLHITGRYTTLLLFWVLLHGLATVRLIQHVLHTFPACASVGMSITLIFKFMSTV